MEQRSDFYPALQWLQGINGARVLMELELAHEVQGWLGSMKIDSPGWPGSMRNSKPRWLKKQTPSSRRSLR